MQGLRLRNDPCHAPAHAPRAAIAGIVGRPAAPHPGTSDPAERNPMSTRRARVLAVSRLAGWF